MVKAYLTATGGEVVSTCIIFYFSTKRSDSLSAPQMKISGLHISRRKEGSASCIFYKEMGKVLISSINLTMKNIPGCGDSTIGVTYGFDRNLSGIFLFIFLVFFNT
jgi:hypothetical protein